MLLYITYIIRCIAVMDSWILSRSYGGIGLRFVLFAGADLSVEPCKSSILAPKELKNPQTFEPVDRLKSYSGIY